MSETTEFVNRKAWSESEPWEFFDNYVEHEIRGALAQRVVERAGFAGTVTILESDRSWGTCEICGGEDADFVVRVNEAIVFTGEPIPSLDALTSLHAFDLWLNGAEVPE